MFRWPEKKQRIFRRWEWNGYTTTKIIYGCGNLWSHFLASPYLSSDLYQIHNNQNNIKNFVRKSFETFWKQWECDFEILAKFGMVLMIVGGFIAIKIFQNASIILGSFWFYPTDANSFCTNYEYVSEIYRFCDLKMVWYNGF